MTEPDDVVIREIKRRTVELVFTVAGAVATIYIMRHFNEPDFGRTAKMWSALKIKQLAEKQVHWWQDIADRATFVYDQEKAW